MKKYVISTSKEYNILIGNDLIKSTGQFICECIPLCKICVITDSSVNNLYFEKVSKSLAKGFARKKIKDITGIDIE